MDVLYTCDNNYVWLMGISAISLFENNKELNNLKVWLLGENISDENKMILKNIGDKYRREINVLDVPQLNIPETLISARWPLSAFTRLFSGELLPIELNKVLYLDCDTIINGSIRELDNWDVSGFIFWGVKDCIGKEYKKNIGLKSNGLYVNAGVLLINLMDLRRVNIYKRLDYFMSKYEKLINYADQDVLNGAFKKHIGVLPPQYDVMTIATTYSYNEIRMLRQPTNYYCEDELNNALKNSVIIHYTTNMLTVRPWFVNTNHPLANEFKKYMGMSPWKHRNLTYMNFCSNESKIVRIVGLLPKKVSLRILGILHSNIKPITIRLFSRR
ncbi:Lipopolysaccharide biosynthesis protein, LPS:glycosyltransferase [Lachnospiraceae bacterium]|nr:Lipopolysaccharide biosynthesis protein, LPS:glycosyltransferase [Lachnospiraceae bacterium]